MPDMIVANRLGCGILTLETVMVVHSTSAFGELLRGLRRDAGLTQEELAERANLGVRTISDLERGVFQTAKVSTARQLVAAFGLEGDERIAFEAAARGDRCRVRSGSANASEGVGHNLPVPATDFIGRTTELAAVGGLLERQEVRLLTLAGAGGTGKTRLAIEVARAARDRFGDCVFFVPLAPITDWRLLISPIAGAIGL